MKLEKVTAFICFGQNIEIRDQETEEIFYKGLLDDYIESEYYEELKDKKVRMICSTNDCDHDDYLVIEVS